MYTKRVSIAVAVSALGLAIAPGVAFATNGQVACGTPAKQAVYSTVVVPGTPAVTHQELEWSSVSEVVERQWHRWQVDSAATPAVFKTVHHDAEYVTTTVPGTPAYDEQELVTAAYDEQVVDVPAHDEQVVDVPAHDEQVVDVPAHDEQVVDVPAHDVQVLDVPAHDEQVVDVPAHDVQVVDVPAHDEQVLVTAAYDEKVLVTAAYDEQVLVTAAYDEKVMTSPAVTVTEYKFVSKNGQIRWDEDPNWNANSNNSSGGWVAANESRVTVVTAAVYTTVHHDAVYTTVHHDAVYTTVHHDAVYKTVTVPDTYKTVTIPATYKTVTVPDTYKTVTIPDTYKTVHHDAVYTTVHHDATPDTYVETLVSPAWDEQVLITPATAEVGHWEEAWSVDSPGDDWSATGETRTVAGETQLVWAAVSPGEGWTATGAYRTVEDAPAVPDSTTQVLVSAAVPAGPACDPKPTNGGGETDGPAPAAPASAVPAAAGLAKPAAVNATTELAFTGSDPRLVLLGLGFLLTGIGVSAGYRKVAQQR